MEVAIIFAIGWVASHAFSEKRDEYSASQEAHREKYLAKLRQNHPSWGHARRERYLNNAARRNALGHFAYLLRHGWSSTFNDFGDGWKKAKAAHEEWKAERDKNGEKKPGWLATFKAGWKNRWGRRAKATGYYEARPDLTPDGSKPSSDVDISKPDGTPPGGGGGQPEPATGTQPSGPTTADGASDAQVVQLRPANNTTQAPGNTAGPTNGSTAVEYNLDASKAEINGIGEYVGSKVSVIEQIIADAMAGDNMTADTESMKHLANLQEALSNVRAHANAFVDSVNKHAAGQEYANTGHAAKTDYLKSS